MNKIRILIADDHNILRQGLIDLLRNYEDIIVVAEASDGEELISKYEKFNPDIILSDIEMPKLSGLIAAKKILKSNPEARFLFLSMFNDEQYIAKIISIGGKGLLSKEIIKDELVLAIRTVHNGGEYYSGYKREEIDVILKRNIPMQKTGSNDLFTPREESVLLEIATGKSSEEIAESLNIGKRTVDSYRATLMEKLNITNASKLIVYAVEYRIKKENSQKSKLLNDEK